MSASEELKKRAGAGLLGKATASSKGLESEASEPKRRPPISIKPVRLSADISPQAYHSLDGYSKKVALRMGRHKIAHVEVIRALLEELEVSSELQERVEDRLNERFT